MCIPSSELAELVGRTLPGAAPTEREHVATVIERIRRGNISAQLAVPRSRFLRNLADQHRHYFNDDVASLIAETDLFGVDLPIVNAIPFRRAGRRNVIVFNGLLQAVRYYADLVNLLNLMLQHRPDEVINLDGSPVRETLAFSMAAFSGMAGAIDRGLSLPPIRALLPVEARRNAAIGYLFAVLFIIAHEIGHLHLGHLNITPELTERIPVTLAVDEDVGVAAAQEFEADRFALMGFRESARENIIPSVLFFLGPFAFLEAFTRGNVDYPLSVNRAENVRRLVAPASDAARIAGEVLAASVASHYRLATLQGTSGHALRQKIHDRMPVTRAAWIIHEVSGRIMALGGFDAGRKPP